MPTSLNDWLALLEIRHPMAIDLGLDRCRAVWQRMGSPRPAPSIFVVAATNGKGSTVATICGLLDGLGYRHGSYTTPHLYRYNERVQLDGNPVRDDLLLAAFERVEAARGGTSLTYFEFGTLAAFAVLAEAGLDHAVMEIGLDHQEYLGPDLESIGREKAGIIRPGQDVICGEAHPPESLLAIAAGQGARLQRLGADFRLQPDDDSVRFEGNGAVLDLPRPALPGPHQFDNMATGVAAVLTRLPEAAGHPEALRRGLQSVRLRGRLERVAERPAVWIDVGHNPLGARAVAVALEEIRVREGIHDCRCVLGMLADKDAAAVVEELQAGISHWYCASLPGSRGQAAEQLAARIETAAGSAALRLFDSVESALDAAIADSAMDDGVLVFGSFLTAAAAGKHWRDRGHG